MALVEITILPVGIHSTSLSEYVVKALKEIEKTDINYELTSMGTILEGDLEKVLEIAKKMHESVFDENIFLVATKIEIDDRRDKPSRIKEKKKISRREIRRIKSLINSSLLSYQKLQKKNLFDPVER